MPDNLVYLLLIFTFSLYALVKGADWLIEGAGSLARRFDVSELIVGLTIVAFGTSLPEMVVSVDAAYSGNTDLAFGNVIGSNITNIFLILGCTAIIYPLTAHPEVKSDIPFFMALVTVFAILGFFPMWPLTDPLSSSMDTFAGFCLLGFFVTFIMKLIKRNANTSGADLLDEDLELNLPPGKMSILIVAGLLLLIFGGDFTVKSASKIASLVGVSDSTIGLTIVAFGTSLPELVTSLIAAGKGKANMAIGNIMGSNLMNLSLVLGLALVIHHTTISFWGLIDMVSHFVISMFFLILMKRDQSPNLSRQMGIFFILAYIAYMTFVGFRDR